MTKIEELLPSADGIEATVEDLLGLDPNDFLIEFVDADGDLMTPGLAAIARLTLGVNYSEMLPLDFDFGDDIPVDIETGGDLLVEFGGELQLDFGVDLTDGLALADRGFLVGYDDVADTGTAAKLTAKVEATGLTMDIVVGGIGGTNVVSGGRIELKDLHTSMTAPPTQMARQRSSRSMLRSRRVSKIWRSSVLTATSSAVTATRSTAAGIK